VSETRSRSDSIREDEELRLPRAPGMFRRFWARHPVFADVLITVICVLIALSSADSTGAGAPGPFPIALKVVAVVASATLLWRRRLPLLPFVTGFVLELAFLFTQQSGGSPLVLVASYSLAVYASSRIAWIGYAIGVTAVSALALPLMATGASTLQGGIDALLNAVVFGLIGTLIGVNVGERKRYLAAIIARSRQLLVERDQQAQLAAAAERARIAREMHDIVSHSLTVIVALSEGAAATQDAAQARSAAASAAETARGALSEMRAMLGVLRDPDSPVPLMPLEPTPPRDTVAAAQRAGYPATLAVTGAADVSPAVAHAVGRIVQEGVTNAMRHAPSASTIAVRLVYGSESVTVEIMNDGVTGSPRDGGFGIRGLTERVAHVDGSLTSSAAGAGRWVLRAQLPIPRATPAESPTTPSTEEDA
jgi:signal transduction histidine kinase